MLDALLMMAALALLAMLLRYCARKSRRNNASLVLRIDAILPQTQCGQCNYAGCKPYAIAIANGEADINQCPPGGEAGVHALADLLSVEYKPLNPAHGLPKPKALAVIDEDLCIGCTLCLQACPVDAILGAAKQMHTVIASECTGCELCLAPCPVDCISMQPITRMPIAESADSKPSYPGIWFKPSGFLQYYRRTRDVAVARDAANRARARHQFRLLRMEREKQRRVLNNTQKNSMKNAAKETAPAEAAKKAAIAAAVERARVLKAQARPLNTDHMPLAVQSEIARIDARRNEAAMRVLQAQAELEGQDSQKTDAEVKPE